MDTEKKKSAKDKFLDKNSTKNGILSLIAVFVLHFGIAGTWVQENLPPYLISYLRKFEDSNNRSLSLLYSYFFTPILTITYTGFMPVCGIIEFKLGCEKSIIIGSLVVMLGYGILYISHNIFLDMFATGLLGIGLCICFVLITKNAILYFYEKRGTIGGVTELISCLMSAGYNKLAENMINPKSEEPTVSYENNLFYTEEMAIKVINYYMLSLGIFGVSTLMTLLFLVPYDQKAAKKLSKALKNKNERKDEKKKPETTPNEPLLPEEDEEKKNDEEKNDEEKNEERKNEEKKNEGEKNEEKKNDEEKNEEKTNDEEKITDPILEKKKKPRKKTTPQSDKGIVVGNVSVSVTVVNYSTAHTKKALKSFRVWKLFILNLCCYLAANSITVMWRPVGINQGISTPTLQLIGTLYFIMTSLGTPFFGFLADKLSFRVLYCIFGGLTTLINFTFCFTFKNELLFAIMVCAINFLYGGYLAAFPPHYMKVFGMKYYVEIGGIIGLASLIMGPISAFFSFFIENSVGTSSGENDQESKDAKLFAYKIIFNSGGVLNVISIIIALFESDDEFDYAM